MFCSKRFHLLKTNWPKYLIFLVWLGINLAAFTWEFYNYYFELKYFYTRLYLKSAVAFAKAGGFVLNINSMLIILLVCRNLISYIRRLLCCFPTNVVRVVDDHITYHIYVGYLIIFFSIVHTLAHILNVEYYVEGYNERITMVTSFSDVSDEQKIKTLLLKLSKETDVNPIKVPNSNPIFESLKLAAGVTGIVLCIVLVIMASSSSKFIRRSFYNVFWYFHQFGAVIYFLAIVTHGIQGIVKEQTNIEDHEPKRCFLFYSDWPFQNKFLACQLPKFRGSEAMSWRWVAVPVAIYLLERLFRFIRGLFSREVAYCKVHPSNVIELAIRNNGKREINYTAGQYVYLKVKGISWFEWHPFTITSAPDDRNLTVHIRTAGDWTQRLFKSLSPDPNGNSNYSLRHALSVDGPYGTSAADVFHYETAVLIGAGIGVTPYASILKHIWHKLGSNRDSLHEKTRLRKVFFFWILPSIDTFEWFGVLLQDLEKEMIEKSEFDLLEYKLYVTRGWSFKDAKQIAINHNEDIDLFTGLRQKTNYGRPNFDAFFKDLAEERNSPENMKKFASLKDDVGVFYCGPTDLSFQLHDLCAKYSRGKINFIFNKENF